jgi:hypothetical protein
MGYENESEAHKNTQGSPAAGKSMSSILTRRNFLRGLLAAPAVVAASSLMPIRGIVMDVAGDLPYDYIQRRIALAYQITKQEIDKNLYNNAFAQSFLQNKIVAAADVMAADILNVASVGERMEFISYA